MFLQFLYFHRFYININSIQNILLNYCPLINFYNALAFLRLWFNLENNYFLVVNRTCEHVIVVEILHGHFL